MGGSNRTVQLIAAAIAGGVLVLGVSLLASAAMSDRARPTESASRTDPLDTEESITSYREDRSEPSSGSWEYASTSDAIRGGEVLYASVSSDPSTYPYAARLTLRAAPDGFFQADVFVNMAVMCRPPGCLIPVAIDGVMDELVFAGTGDGVRVADAGPFIVRLASAKELVVEVPTASLGAMQFKFDVRGLGW